MSESQGGGAYSPEPTGEEGAGSHCVGTAGTTVRKHTYTQTLDFNSLKHSNYNCELKTSSVKAGPLDYINSHTHSIFQHYSVCTCSAGVRKGVEVGLLLNCKLCWFWENVSKLWDKKCACFMHTKKCLIEIYKQCTIFFTATFDIQIHICLPKLKVSLLIWILWTLLHPALPSCPVILPIWLKISPSL